ncbi:MAG: prepilin peptidase [Synergistaceae bacterium]|nr:prepilin peptidase [Synergistaceae bacterium]
MGNITVIYVFLGFLLGACLGSFVNAAALRTVAEKKWWGNERSVCVHCGRVLAPLDLIPVVSFLMLHGRCRTCHRQIAPRYFITETGTGIMGAVLVWYCGSTPALFFSFAALVFLLFHTLTDLETGYIYDSWAIAMAVTGAILRIWGGIPALIDGAAGAALGFGVIILIVILSRGGMGFGDAMLMLGTGALFGWKMTILCLYLGFLCGGLVVTPLLIMKKVSRKDSVPLGPFLAAGSMIAIFAARPVFQWLGFSLPWPWII